jgi:hypothetical protein
LTWRSSLVSGYFNGLEVRAMARHRLLLPSLALFVSMAAAQDCTTTVLVSFYDQRTTEELQKLKSEDIEVRMHDTPLPLIGFTRDFQNRLLILLETDGAGKDDKLDELVQTVTQQARTAGEGKPVAFGIFAKKALFTTGFFDDPRQRTREINSLIEEAGNLGKGVALWDALHQALALFGPHQPGDTILLVSDPYDDASRYTDNQIEKEFLSRGTRIFMMQRRHASRTEYADFMWRTHDREKMILDRLTDETGGLLSEYVPSLIRFAWAGYMLEVKLPPGMDKPHKWKVQFRGPAAVEHRKTNFHYPLLLPPCSTAQASR